MKSYMNIVLIVIFSVNTIASQLILKKGISNVSAFHSTQASVSFILNVMKSPYTIGAITLQGIGYMVWILVLSRVKLGLAFSISGSFFYILLSLASWAIYNERLSIIQWVGIVIITSGVVLLTLK